MIEQEALFFNWLATEANIALASLDKLLVLFPLKVILGRLRLQVFMVANESIIALQQSGSGHLPIPSASTGWH
jgi:hypothetical protein